MKHPLFTCLTVVTLAAPSLFGAEVYDIKAEKSKISFSIMNKPPGAKEAQAVPGSFKDFSGKIVFDKANPSKSSVEVEVKTTSIDTANEKRDAHLRNQDFFKVKEYPKMTFKSTKVSKEGSDYQVEGEFTLLNETKTITVTFKPSGENGGKVNFQIKRSDYGMTYRVPDTADEVDVTLEIVGKKQ